MSCQQVIGGQVWEFCQTNHKHPSITSGQHTNGPARIWIRKPGGEWEDTGDTRMDKVRERLLQSVGMNDCMGDTPWGGTP